MSESEGDEPLPKRRRGVINKDKYKANVIRISRIKGQEYVNSKNSIVAQKIKPVGITCKCSFKCSAINQTVIDTTWNNFYLLASKDIQDTYLQTLIEKVDIKRRKKQANEPEIFNDDGNVGLDDTSHDFKRKSSYTYNLKIDGLLKAVCKGCFMQVHGISKNRLSRIVQLLGKHETPTDKRGKNKSGNVISGLVCSRIYDHISKFDLKETHYGGNLKKYLDSRLNVKLMYEMFLSENPDLINRVKYSFYYKYYKENFDYSFGRPQVDVCSQCESLNAKLKNKELNPRTKLATQGELDLHKRRARKFYSKMKAATENTDDDTAFVCFDYMQNLPLPNIPVQEIFYMRQLWVNVFAIHNLKTNKSKIYMYHEGEANKSPNEVCTMLLDYIKTELPETVKHLVLFSDGPSGQNKNHSVCRFLMNLCDRGVFSTVKHNFPVRGHSYSACDRDFGAIKRKIKNVDRLYTPDQYEELIMRASNNNRFKVHKLTTQEVLNFKDWWPVYYKKTTSSIESSCRATPAAQREGFKISTYKEFVYKAEAKGKVEVSEYIDGVIKSTFSLLKTAEVPNLPVEMAYPEGKVNLK